MKFKTRSQPLRSLDKSSASPLKKTRIVGRASQLGTTIIYYLWWKSDKFNCWHFFGDTGFSPAPLYKNLDAVLESSVVTL